MTSLHDLLHLARTAGNAAAGYLRSATPPERAADWGRKGRSDFVTEVDRRAEEIIAGILLDGAPGSTVMGEELTPQAAASSLTWVVDPLDGTTNFLHGYPSFGVSIAAVVDATLQVGVVVDVGRGGVYAAAVGHGATVDGHPLAVSPGRAPADALIGTGFPFKHPEEMPRYLEQFHTVLSRTSGVRRAGAAALDLVDVARGRLDGFWELRLAPWDVAAGTLIVREAGGIVTNVAGHSDVVTHGSIIAGNPAIHAWLLETMAEVDGTR